MLLVDPVLYGFFIGAVFLLVLTPGPVVSLIIAETLSHSARHGLAVVLGAALSTTVMLVIYLLGFSTIIGEISPPMFNVVRGVGAAYLMYLATRAFRAKANPAEMDGYNVERTPAKAFRSAVIIGATNPKAILFFAAFFPQFIAADLEPAPQLNALALTFAVLAPALDGGWVLAAATARKFLMKQSSALLINRISGSALALGAVLLLFLNN